MVRFDGNMRNVIMSVLVVHCASMYNMPVYWILLAKTNWVYYSSNKSFFHVAYNAPFLLKLF